jgi:hypothetical protein
MVLASKPTLLLFFLMVLASKPSTLLLLDLTPVSLLGPPPILGRTTSALFVHPRPLDVELMINLDMLHNVFHFGGEFHADGDFVNYINPRWSS